jgi:hypothetical protein
VQDPHACKTTKAAYVLGVIAVEHHPVESAGPAFQETLDVAMVSLRQPYSINGLSVARGGVSGFPPKAGPSKGTPLASDLQDAPLRPQMGW